MDALRRKIENQLSTLGHVGNRLPKAWQKVRHCIEERKEDHCLSYKELTQICNEYGLDQEEDTRVVARYLCWLGVIVYFEHDSALHDFIIIDPEWALNALYSVLQRDEVQLNGGRLQREFFFQVLREKHYKEDEIHKLLNLLTENKFELCYALEGSSEQVYIVPQLLPTKTPSYQWNDEDGLYFEYQYPFMPKGLIARFIIRLNERIEKDESSGQQMVWNKGVVLNYREARADIREVEDRQSGGKLILIRVSGQLNARIDFLNIIRYEIDKTHKRISKKLKVTERIPCNCSVCKASKHPKMFPYDDLQGHVKNKLPTILCNVSYKQVSIVRLLEGVTQAKSLDLRGIEGLSPGSNWFKLLQLSFGKQREDVLLELLRLSLTQRHTINVTADARSTANVSVVVTVEQKNESCLDLSAVLQNILEDARKQLPGADAKIIGTEIENVDESVAKLEDATENDRKLRGSVGRLKDFVNKISDATDTTGKLVQSLEKGAEYAGKVISLYNKVAPFFLFPSVKNPFAK